VVEQSPFASAPVLNTNSRALPRWSQQASPAASTSTAAELVASLTTHQACAAGPSKSGLPHTPAALCRLPRQPFRIAFQYRRLRDIGASRGQAECRACSKTFLASVHVGGRSPLRSRPFVASACLLASNARQAKPAEIHWLLVGRRVPHRLMANPSVKGTSTSGLRPLAAAPYVER
jgi:hypothetical protein